MAMLLLPDVGTDLTIDNLASLPAVDGYDYELDHGRLRIMARGAMSTWHADMQVRVVCWLRAAGRTAFPRCGIVLDHRTTRSPDIGVLWERPPTLQNAYHPARKYALAIEIISPHSRNEDQFEKPRLYAAAGVPALWLVDTLSDDESDGLVKMYKLELTGYTLVRTVTVSELEAKPPAD